MQVQRARERALELEQATQAANVELRARKLKEKEAEILAVEAIKGEIILQDESYKIYKTDWFP